jgi:hypothetical protein
VNPHSVARTNLKLLVLVGSCHVIGVFLNDLPTYLRRARTRRFITVFTRARNRSLFWASWIHCTPPRGSSSIWSHPLIYALIFQVVSFLLSLPPKTDSFTDRFPIFIVWWWFLIWMICSHEMKKCSNLHISVIILIELNQYQLLFLYCLTADLLIC